MWAEGTLIRREDDFLDDEGTTTAESWREGRFEVVVKTSPVTEAKDLEGGMGLDRLLERGEEGDLVRAVVHVEDTEAREEREGSREDRGSQTPGLDGGYLSSRELKLESSRLSRQTRKKERLSDTIAGEESEVATKRRKGRGGEAQTHLTNAVNSEV